MKSRKQKSKDSRKKKDDDHPRSGLRTLSTYVGIYNRIGFNDASESLGKELLEHISLMTSRLYAAEQAAEHEMLHDCDPEMCSDDNDCPVLQDANTDYLRPYGCPFEERPDIYERCAAGTCKNCDEIIRNSIFLKLANARRFSMITLCFRDPSLDVAPHMAFVDEAWGIPTVVDVVTQRYVATPTQHSLDSLIVQPSRDLLEQLRNGYRPCRISNIAVPGVVVREEWLDWRESAVIPVAVCFFFTIVVGSRFLFGDWQTGSWRMFLCVSDYSRALG